ncbi:hypothetical protein [Parafilimonas sp.]|uniref:hypothetical protein n=1 Tax=Parafilimonas sp. TaxID=1969739 RepID=UPI0039E51218
MKKVFTILLLSIHLFNVFAYRLLFSVMEQSAGRNMIAILDNNNYEESELVLLKFALHAPYIQNNGACQRCDGQVEMNGVQYNYVKRMVRNDTLYLYCIANRQKTDINNCRLVYASHYSCNSSDKKAEQGILKQFNAGNEYHTTITGFNLNALLALIHKTAALNNCATLKGFIRKTIQPPDLFV